MGNCQIKFELLHIEICFRLVQSGGQLDFEE